MGTPDALIDSIETRDMVGSPRRLSRRAWLAITGAACALIPLSWAAFRWLRPSRFEAAVERLRAAGEPVSFDDLRRLYDDMPTRNAEIEAILERVFAVVSSAEYEQATRQLPIVGDDPNAVPDLGQPWAKLEAAEKFLDRYAPTLADLHRLSALRGSALLTKDAGDYAPLDLMLNYRAPHRVLRLEAAVALHRGDASRLTTVIAASRRLGRLITNIPSSVVLSLRWAVDQAPLSHLHASIGVLPYTNDELERLAEAFAIEDHRRHLRHALIGNRVATIDALRDPVRQGAPSWLRWSPFADSDMLTGLDICDRAIDATKLPWPEVFDATEAATAPLQVRLSWLSMLRLGRAAHASGSFERYADIAARVQVNELLATTAIAVERYRRAHGDMPQTAEALVPAFLAEAPVDPFDGQPLRYKPSETELVIYSIGPDRNDDGGASTSDTPGHDEPDLVLRLPLARWSASP